MKYDKMCLIFTFSGEFYPNISIKQIDIDMLCIGNILSMKNLKK